MAERAAAPGAERRAGGERAGTAPPNGHTGGGGEPVSGCAAHHRDVTQPARAGTRGEHPAIPFLRALGDVDDGLTLRYHCVLGVADGRAWGAWVLDQREIPGTDDAAGLVLALLQQAGEDLRPEAGPPIPDSLKHLDLDRFADRLDIEVEVRADFEVDEPERAPGDGIGPREDADDAEQDPDPGDSAWYDTGGVVAERTNTAINGLLAWARREDLDKVTRSNVRDAVEQLTAVGAHETVAEYVNRVTRHGPFDRQSNDVWRIEWDAVARREAPR